MGVHRESAEGFRKPAMRGATAIAAKIDKRLSDMK